MKSKTLRQISKENVSVLTEYESKNVLREYGINCPREALIKISDPKKYNEEKFLSQLEKEKNKPKIPFYLKISSRDILHKTDAGVVKKVDRKKDIPIIAGDILKNAVRYNPKAEIQGIIVSEDVSGDENREMILGATTDEQFGHIISLGIGGISVEIYEDIELRATPISKEDVYSMIENLRGKKILSQFRGNKPIKKDLLISNTLKFSKIIEENPEIEEMDINPLMVGPDNVRAVDALIKISRG